MAKNRNIHQSKNEKTAAFYTQISLIENELKTPLEQNRGFIEPLKNIIFYPLTHPFLCLANI